MLNAALLLGLVLYKFSFSLTNVVFEYFCKNQSFGIHKQLGTYGKFLIPAHVSGAFFHFFRGQTIFARVNPFRSPKH